MKTTKETACFRNRSSKSQTSTQNETKQYGFCFKFTVRIVVTRNYRKEREKLNKKLKPLTAETIKNPFTKTTKKR